MTTQKRDALVEISPVTTVTTIWHDLLHDIRYGRYKECEKLPPETLLSAELGISRTQLRDGLAILEQCGFITRRRRVGTIINRHILDIDTKIDIEIEFLDVLKQAGYELGIIQSRASTVTGNEKVATKLQISPSDPVLSVERVVTANGQPAIYCNDYIPFARIVDDSYTFEDLKPPIFCFIEKFCKTAIDIDLTEITPYIADAEMSRLLCIPVGTLMLHFDEVAYNGNQEIIMYSDEYYVDGLLNHTILRKKI